MSAFVLCCWFLVTPCVVYTSWSTPRIPPHLYVSSSRRLHGPCAGTNWLGHVHVETCSRYSRRGNMMLHLPSVPSAKRNTTTCMLHGRVPCTTGHTCQGVWSWLSLVPPPITSDGGGGRLLARGPRAPGILCCVDSCAARWEILSCPRSPAWSWRVSE